MMFERVWDLLQLPFMQRALLGGMLMGLTGGFLGSFAILRQLAFFSDALGHSALLGIVLAVALEQEPTWVLLPYGIVFALGVTFVLERTALAVDAVLNIVYSSSLALAVISLTFVRGYRGSLNQLLFGDILGVNERTLWLTTGLLCVCIVTLGLTWRSQLLLTLHPPLAKAQGVNLKLQKLGFIILLSLVVALSIRAVGVLLVSAFIVIPASTARLLSRQFGLYSLLAMGLGLASAVTGIVLSAAANLPSGPSIVVVQLGFFLLALLGEGLKRFRFVG